MKDASQRAFNRALIPVLLIQALGAMGYGVVFPVMPYYVAQFGGTPLSVGLLGSAYAVCAFFAAPVLGALSDRYGRRPVLLFSLIGTCIGFILLGIGGSLLVLFLGRIIDGISAGNMAVAQAYVADITEGEERTTAFGLMGAADVGRGGAGAGSATDRQRHATQDSACGH